MTSLLAGGAVAILFATSAFAERGTDGTLNIMYWQAPSLMNPYLSGSTKEVDAAALVLEPLASYDKD
ncbi:MAG: peptide ABC transporter substrate-binding protein, partial [Mesorhizobium sp.]